MTKTAWLLAASLALNLGLAGALALSLTGPEVKRDDVHEHTMPYEHLGLSPEQRSLLDAERHKFHGELQERTRTLHELRETLLDLLAVSPPDRLDINAVQQRIHEQQAAIQRLVIEHLLALQGSMTPEQGSRFRMMLKERMGDGGSFCPERH